MGTYHIPRVFFLVILYSFITRIEQMYFILIGRLHNKRYEMSGPYIMSDLARFGAKLYGPLISICRPICFGAPLK